MTHNLIANKQIAIIGGGPVGLTTARLLQLKGAVVTVYERDINSSSRNKGSSLDLHKETGQKAIIQAGLWKEFKAASRPVAQIVSDIDEKIIFRMKADKDKPEIDRPDLRRILLESLLPNTVVWDKQVISITTQVERYELIFQNNEKAQADIVIIADGTMSKARKFLTESLPQDTGTFVIQGEIVNPKITCPNINKMIDNSNLACVQDKKTIFTHIKADASICLHASFRKSEKWIRENPFDFNDKEAVNKFLYDLYKDWNPIYHELFTACDNYIGFPLKVFSVNEILEPHTNIAIVGDAAHVMPPFGGWGVNMGMVDGMTLTENLTNEKFDSIESAIADYEQKMMAYAAPVQRGTHEADDRVHTTTAHSFNRMKKNMMLNIAKVVQYAALFFLFLVVSVFWGIWLGLSRSYDLFSITELVTLGKVMMPNLAIPMRFISPGCLLLMAATAYLLPSKKSKEFYFVLAAIGFVLISLLVTVLVEVPINNQVITWTETSAPTDWKEILNRWLFFNVVRTLSAIASFCFFTAAILKPFDFERQS